MSSKQMPRKKILIAPSILSADFGSLSQEARDAERAGADWLHVDVMDGRFVPNLTIGFVAVKALRRAVKIPLDVHLMIERPERYIERFAEAGAVCHGIDLTERSISHTRRRFDFMNLRSELQVGDAEQINYADNTFDMVYSWGVIHCSPNTARAAQEILRVLKPNGVFKCSIYHRRSIVG